MASEWKTYKVSEFADVIGGGTPSTKNDDFWVGDIPWITPKDLSNHTNRYISDGERKITEEGLTNSSAKMLPANTILLSSRAPVGYLAIAKQPLCTNQGIRNLVIKEGFSPEFIYYLLKNNIDYLKRNASGTTFQELSGGTLKTLEFNIPDYTTQREIAHILGTLDDKIELNQRMNETLEEIARAVFKSWFVDFDPVRAKMAGESYPLPDEEMALFPDELVDSDLGMIPKGWEVSTIGEEVELVGGGTPSTKNPEYWENGIYNFATPKDLSRLTSSFLLDTERKVTKAGLGKISSGLLEKETLLMSSRAPVGYLAINQIPVCVNQGIVAMKCDRSLSAFYMLNWAKVHMEEIRSRASGTTFAELSKRNFRPMNILVPKSEIVKQFDTLISFLYNSIKNNLVMNKTLLKERYMMITNLFQ